MLPRSDPDATTGFQGDDAPPPVLSEDAAGEKVAVQMLPLQPAGAGGVKRERDDARVEDEGSKKQRSKGEKAGGSSR